MKKKKPSLLREVIVERLKSDGLDEYYIEFFGQVSGMAYALNNSPNSIKAAWTMLSRPRTVEMLQEFFDRKLRPPADKSADAAKDALRQFKIEKEAEDRDRAERWQEERLHPGFNGPEDEDEGEEE
jgi:hypothetical protein